MVRNILRNDAVGVINALGLCEAARAMETHLMKLPY
jgi:hypothetical protein